MSRSRISKMLDRWELQGYREGLDTALTTRLNGPHHISPLARDHRNSMERWVQLAWERGYARGRADRRTDLESVKCKEMP